MIKTDTLIIGGGVAGLSTAYALGASSQKSVLVLEQEKKLGGHASGRNAGMLRQALPDLVLAKLARESRKMFQKLQTNGWKRMRLRENGSLILSKESKRSELEAIEKALRNAGIAYEWLPRYKTLSKVPLLADADYSLALFCPSDAMVDLDGLLGGFVKALKEFGISVKFGSKIQTITRKPKGFEVVVGGQTIFTKKLVNAAGAWAGAVAAQAGAADIPLQAYRRHLFFSKKKDASCERWPFVWDLQSDFYFRPMGDGILLSPCDKTLEMQGDRHEKIDPKMEGLVLDKMKKFSSVMSGWKVAKATSGLRTMTPDGRFVVGEDTRIKDFYWVAGLGGHGVTTCFSVGKLAADLMLRKKTDPVIKKALSPERFKDNSS